MKSPAVLAAEAAAKRAADKYVSRDGVPKAAPRTKVEVERARASRLSPELFTVARFIMERKGDPWKPGRVTMNDALCDFSKAVGIPLFTLYEEVGPTLDAVQAELKAKRDAKKAAKK